MSRLPLLTLEQADVSIQPNLEKAINSSGFLSNLLAVLANAPVALQAYQDLSALNAKASLSLAEREVVQLVAGTTHGCTFCVAGHTSLATHKAKLDPIDIQALRERRFADINDPRLRAVALFTEQIILTRAKVSDPVLNAFYDEGYGPQQALEIITGVGLATICNFANNLAHTPLNSQLEDYAWHTN